MRYIWSLALAVLCLAGPASATTYTVSTSGSDANDGVGAPLRTLQAANWRLQPGDTLLIQPGTYTAGIDIDQPNVTVRGVGEVILDGTNATMATGVHVGPTSGVTIDNLKVRNCRLYGIMVGDCTNVTVANCEASGNAKTGILSGHSSDLTIRNCVAAYNKAEHGIYCSESGDRLRILNNTMYGNARCGLQVNATQDVAIPGDPFQDGLSADCLIAGNTLHDNCTAGNMASNLAGVVNSTIANNLVYNEPGGAFALWDDGMGAEYCSRNNRILHNTILVSGAKSQVGIVVGEGCTGNQLYNNIISVQNGSALEADTPVQSNFNILLGPGAVNDGSLAAWRNATGNDQNSQSVDPRLGGDYRPLSGSPAIDGGTRVYDTDKDGSPRPQGANPDLGCYETGGAAPPPVVTPPATPSPPTPAGPAAPAGLTATAGDGRVDLRWNAVSGSLRGYVVYRSTSAGGTQVAMTASPQSGITFADTRVQNGTTYWYQICAVDTAGIAGALSSAVSATPAAPTTPAPPTTPATPTTPAPPAAQTFTISGKVTLNGVGLSGVTVSTGTASTTTGTDGSYSLANLPAGGFTVTASKSGYTLSAPQKVTVGPSRTGINFTAQAPAPPATASTVIYADAPLSGWSASGSRASYSLTNGTPVKEGARSISLAITRANGYFQLGGSTSKGIDVSGKTTLKFCVHGGTTGGQALQVRASVDGSLQAPVNLAAFGGLPVSGGWVEYTIPLSALKVTRGKLTAVRFSAPVVTKTAYVDSIRVE